jgi:hypothetical protein
MKTPKGFDLEKALKELGINVPVMRVDQLPDGRFRLFLYGGHTADWPQPLPPAPAPKSRTKKHTEVKQ